MNNAIEMLQHAVATGQVPATATAIGLGERILARAAFGTRGWDEHDEPVTPDTPFLVASLTKPVVCVGAMLLLQEGQLALDDKVAEFLPDFGKAGKKAVTVRHIMTHTSGLPDQLQENVTLRQQHAGLEQFAAAVYRLSPLFPPGTSVRYQSMGILMLGQIIEAIAGLPLRAFLTERVFESLEMPNTTLGLPAGGLHDAVIANDSAIETQSNVHSDWGWNSLYWRDLGAPWGGLHASANDLGRLLQHMLGVLPGPLSPSARRAMLGDQTAMMPEIAMAQKVTTRWGLGWRLRAPAYGDLVSPDTFGHTGATGTVFWADPASGLWCVLLTNRPESHRLFRRYANAIAATLRN